ncbi:MAG: ATP-binding protein [Gemmatimonadaceae bacterium]
MDAFSNSPTTEQLTTAGGADAATELYRLLVESVVDYAIFALDRHGNVLSWNRGAERLKGYKAAEIIGKHFSTFYPDVDLDAGKPAWELDVATRNGRVEDEGWRIRKDGSRFWANVVITALRDPSGELVGFAKLTRDLTARREAEQSARDLAAAEAARTEAERAEQFTTSIIASIGDPFVAYDGDWRFKLVNKAAAEGLGGEGGWTTEQLQGRVLWDTYPMVLGTVFEHEMKRSMTERVPVTFEGFRPETGRWTEAFCYPMPGGGLAVQWKNITARKRADEATYYLARSADVLASSLDYNATLDALAKLIVPRLGDWCAIDLIEVDGSVRQLAIAHADPAKLQMARELSKRFAPKPDASTGMRRVMRTGEPELLVDVTDEMLAASATSEEHLQILRELGLRSAIIVPLTARDRTLGTLSLISAESQRRYDGSDLALLVQLGQRAGLAVDNARLYAEAQATRAEAERARNDAERANRAKSEFLAHMSHELRTPLNAIGGYSQLIEIGIHGPVTADQIGALHRIDSAQRRLLALVNDVLNFARLEAGRVDYVIRAIPLREVVSNVLPMVEPQLEAKSIQLSHAFTDEAPDAPLLVSADREKLEQVLLNLLSNAAKFTDDGGNVDVVVSKTCADSKRRVQISVSDTGIGIPNDKLGAIFEPFVQVGRTTKSNHEGTGLGLAISRDLARAMGGDIVVSSVVGRGSTFTLTLEDATK